MHTARAASTYQGKVTRIIAFFNSNTANRIRHVLVDDGTDTKSRVSQINLQWISNVRLYRLYCFFFIQGHTTA